MNMDGRVRFLICLIILICIGYSESQANGNFCGDRIPCDNWECIDKEKWCDSVTDCDDKSDEKYCRTNAWFGFSSVDNKCTVNHFQCDNAQCVPVVTECDGYANCKDRSDENNCGETTSEMPLINEGSNSEEILDNNTDEDFGDTTEMGTNEASFPDSFENVRHPVMGQISSTTQDYYRRRMSESINQEKQTVRNQEFDYNSRSDYHQQQYHGRPNEPRQQKQYVVTHIPTHSTIPPNGQQNLHQSQASRNSFQHSGGSDTAPTASFPSNEERPVYHWSSYPPTTDPIHPSLLSEDRDTGRSPRNSRRQMQPQAVYSPRDPPDARTYPISEQHRTNINDYHNQNRRNHRVFSQRQNYVSSPRQKIILPPFHFRVNYTQSNGYRYEDTIQKAERWLTDQRTSSYGWGNDTARALVALSLISNSFLSNITENNFMKKNLKVHLGIKLLTELKVTDFLNENSIKLAQYINALLATCQDPRDFFGQDLVERLWHMKNDVLRQERFVNPFIYTTLCLVNAHIIRDDLDYLESLLVLQDSDEKSKDTQILATTALACFQHNKPELRLNKKLEQASRDVLSRKFSDGSFGSMYTTAIAAQALMSVDNQWEPRKTLDYLMRNQSEDGSFGDMLATYYILPTLSGRSLLHLRNTQCDPPPVDTEKEWSPLDILNYSGPKIRVSYTVKIGNPPTTTIPTYVSVPEGTNFFLILRIVELLNPVFKFSFKVVSDRIDVHTISGVPNDPERGYYWHLFDSGGDFRPYQNEEYTGDIRELFPVDSQELVFWYY